MKTVLTKEQQKVIKKKSHPTISGYLHLYNEVCSQQYFHTNIYCCLCSNGPHPLAAEQTIFVKNFIKTAANCY